MIKRIDRISEYQWNYSPLKCRSFFSVTGWGCRDGASETAESSRLCDGDWNKRVFILTFTLCWDAGASSSRTNLNRWHKMTGNKWGWWHVTRPASHWSVCDKQVLLLASGDVTRSRKIFSLFNKLSHLIDKQIPSHSILFRAFLIQLNSIKRGAGPLNMYNIVHRILSPIFWSPLSRQYCNVHREPF